MNLWFQGANSYGQLGQRGTEDLAEPQHAESSLLKEGVSCITGGGGHSVLITGKLSEPNMNSKRLNSYCLEYMRYS